ncbi:MAG: LLM class flavin-dependent oxidoreductase [Armatimonadota bacterium]
MVKLGMALAGDKPLGDYLALAKTVEEYGFETLTIYDDLMFKPVWPLLTAVALNTRRVRLGPGIVNPYLVHPAILAGNVALLDEFSNGRAYLGIGKGAFLEFLSVEQPTPITTVREAIEIIKRLLRGDRTPYHGKVFHAAESAFFRWSPLRPDVPIMVGTWGEKMTQMAGEIADEVKASAMWNTDYAAMLAGHIRTGTARARRNPESVGLVIGPLTSVAEDRAAARERARLSLAIYLPYLHPMTEFVGVEPALIGRVNAASSHGDYAGAARLISDDVLGRMTLCGTPHDIIAEIERMVAAASVRRIEFGTPHGPNEADAIRLLGEKVLPHFASGRS